MYQLAMLLVLHFKGYSILGLTDETVRRSLILHFQVSVVSRECQGCQHFHPLDRLHGVEVHSGSAYELRRVYLQRF